MTALKRLVNSTATYALANVINSAIPFLLLPVLTRVLEPTEYGLVAMFTTIITVFSAFTGLSLHGAVSVRYFNTETDHPRFVGSCLAVLSCSTAIVLTVVWILSDFLSGLVGLPRAWLLLAVLGASFQALINIRLVMWQIKGVAIRYGFFQVFQTLFNLGFSLWLVIFVGLGWEGRGWGVLSALLVFGAIAVFSLFASGLASRHISGEYVRASLKFGVPLIPHSVGGLMTAISDRFILVALIGLASAGSYQSYEYKTVNKDVPAYALMVGVPARQIGWMSEFGEQLELPVEGEGSAPCIHTGATYVLRGKELRKESQA